MLTWFQRLEIRIYELEIYEASKAYTYCHSRISVTPTFWASLDSKSSHLLSLDLFRICFRSHCCSVFVIFCVRWLLYWTWLCDRRPGRRPPRRRGLHGRQRRLGGAGQEPSGRGFFGRQVHPRHSAYAGIPGERLQTPDRRLTMRRWKNWAIRCSITSIQKWTLKKQCKKVI